MNNRIKFYIGILLALTNFIFFSCSDNYPKSKEEPYATDLLSIKIINAGAEGNTIVDGTIDEENKMVSFPRLDTLTDFSAINVDAKVSEGAKITQSVFDFSMSEEESFKTLILRVINQNRYKDYFIKVRKNIPVFGADFEKPIIYNFSGDSIYTSFKSLLTRGTAFDGKYVLIVSRGSLGPHLLKVSDLEKGTILPIKLDLTGITGGTYLYNQGALSGGHIFLASLAGSKATPLKIYFWDTPSSSPKLIADIDLSSIVGSGTRYGDNMSVDLDTTGNGYIYFGDNASQTILRLKVSSYKTVSSPTLIKSNSNATAFMNINLVTESKQYIWSGVRTQIMLTDEVGNVKYTMQQGSIADESIDPRIFTFNQERYLLVCTAGLGSASTATPSLYIYNITKGSSVEDALREFDQSSNHNADFSFSLGGMGNSAPSAQTGYYIKKDKAGNDSILYVFGARTDSGFAICKFPIKQQNDN
ncbi:MAG: DUF4623 domain-containing protein [Prevotella sp.]|jgi:hypothetical protein|nr:DUF4623 domain-containing protein [Prevotella sp.]